MLANAGYHARDVLFHGAADLLRTAQFDLIILSASLTDREKQQILELVDGRTPILSLWKMLFASELLRQVEHKISMQTSAAR